MKLAFTGLLVLVAIMVVLLVRRGTLRYRAYRESGEACERTDAEVRERLHALRERERTYERR